MEPDQGALMFARIVVGLLIGVVAGFVEASGPAWSAKWQRISEALLFLVGLAFIGSSFMFGAIYGVMAIAEIAVGFYAYGKVFRSKKASL
jgi:NhaP-type Na+/H+ or K+/H+ antiporter